VFLNPLSYQEMEKVMFKTRFNSYRSFPLLLLVLLFGGIGQITVKADTVIQSVAVNSTPMDVAVSPSGDRVYITNQRSNTVSVIDTTTTPNTVIANVAAPAGSGINWDVTRISSTTTTDSLLTLLGVTKKPKGVAANAAGTRVYVACLGIGSAGKVDVIDTTF
jgi:YVTN family beta-propeller protein